jgi:hypothetical protein
VPTATDTLVPTPTETLVPTATPKPLPPEVEIGDPDGDYVAITCGSDIIIDLGAPTAIGTLVYYEHYNPTNCGGGICLDWVIIELSLSADGPWTPYFYWGDGSGSNNGDILPYHFASGELDNEHVPATELYNLYGIRILVGGTYRYVRVSAPMGCDDPAQVDAIDILP